VAYNVYTTLRRTEPLFLLFRVVVDPIKSPLAIWCIRGQGVRRW